MQSSRIRIGLATLLVMATVAGTAFGAATQAQPAPASVLDSFGGTTSAVVISHHSKPLYRERTVRTHYRLHRVACAPAPGVSPTTACYAAG